ncbi:arylsulfatase [Lentisphaera profundi]|uniref:Arylsulfatase n=1 Tax=Lentisphaera profundi TaxID=1658616 RepID=A0ABY7VQL8_9BACT|nr:arylsulfatase [Lentisphaera profundi]WDE96486.1 arylsulfatase [Lentisphaera profundi]
MLKPLITSLLFIASLSSFAAERPNIVLILTDDQGYGEVAAHGNEIIQTPEMDKLYHEGVRLDNYHVNSICSPSRAALVTGRYASRVGVWHTLGGRNIIRKDEKTMADHFSTAGYTTGMVGKWHLGDNAPYRPEDRGFQDVFRIGGGSIGQLPDYWKNNLWDGHYWHNDQWVKTKGFCTDVQFDYAIDFIEKNQQKSFFLFVSTTAPHSPTGADKKYLEPYEKAGLDKGICAFYGMVTNIDDNIGRLRNKLRELKLEENTIVIFCSDNGSACDKKGDSFNGGMNGKKGSLYDGGHRVPCFLYWPKGGWVGGKQLDQLTAHIDLLPTLLAACAIKDSLGVKFDGIDLQQIIANPAKKLSRTLITENKANKRDQKFQHGVILHDDWRLIEGEQLFDIQSDFPQKENVAKDHSETVKMMRDSYSAWYQEIKGRFDELTPIEISSEEVELYSMDLYPNETTAEKGKVVWNQKGVSKGEQYRGFWALDIKETGQYKISLRRWPHYLKASLTTDGDSKTKALSIKSATLTYAGKTLTTKLNPQSEQADFQVDLAAGSQKLQAEFIDAKGKAFSAYYVYIQKL